MTKKRTGGLVLRGRATLSPMWVFSLSALLAFGVAAAGQDNTGWLSPSADSGDFSNGSYAYHLDGRYAEARFDERHQYWGYAISVPQGSTISGIEVRLDAYATGWEGLFSALLYAELSWDGGNSWTASRAAGLIGPEERSYVLGGPLDTWGRSWDISELTSELFRVRLRAHCHPQEIIYLNWVAVRVYFTGPSLTLTLDPVTVNLGSLTLEDYERGYRDWDSAQEISLSASGSWTLYVSATSSTWSYTGDLPDPNKPCGHLLWKVLPNPSGPVTRYQANFTPLSASDVEEVAAGSAGNAVLQAAFRLVVDYDTTPAGSYSLDFCYTLVSP